MEQGDSDLQKRLLGAAQALADATYRMVEAAKVGLALCMLCPLSLFLLIYSLQIYMFIQVDIFTELLLFVLH